MTWKFPEIFQALFQENEKFKNSVICYMENLCVIGALLSYTSSERKIVMDVFKNSSLKR